MKRTYSTGCKWCNATGFVSTWYHPTNALQSSTSTLTNVCPVCKGSGTI